MRRSPWFWLTIVTVATVALLTGGTIAAKDLHQSVEWYTGVGQWLGALGSLLAAGMALWIATTDRRRTDDQREAEKRERDADLLREAGLVRVRFEEIPRRQAFSGKAFGEDGIRVRNRRGDSIFDVDIHAVTVDGEHFPFDVSMVSVNSDTAVEGTLTDRLIESHQELLMFSELPPHTGEKYAAVRYTDQHGRRWQVDTNGTAARVGADGNQVSES